MELNQKNILIDFGSKIRECRINKKWNHHVLASLIGMTEDRLKAIENGEVNMQMKTIFKLADCLDISLEDFFSKYDQVVDVT